MPDNTVNYLFNLAYLSVMVTMEAARWQVHQLSSSSSSS